VSPSIVEWATLSSWSRTVDVAVAVHVDQVRALSSVHDHRVLAHPAALLGERVPQVRAVGGGEIHLGRH
jgi:hypothetical protein